MEGRLEDRVRALEARLEGRLVALEEGLADLRQEVKTEINTAFNKAMLLFTAIGVVLALFR
ncbi:hypothetical protein [Thermus sp.]